MVVGLPKIDQPNKLCEGCMLGKQHRKSFVKQIVERTTKTMELIHLNMCGLVNTMCLGKSNCFITFVNDYSKKIWVFMLKQKSYAFKAFKTFKLIVEKQIGNALKVLQINGSGEYYSDEFKNFCVQEGTIHEVIVPYTP